MTRDYRATPEQWAFLEQWAEQDPDPDACCFLELRARVEALEEAENDRRFEQAKAILDKPVPAPAGSLVERVADAINIHGLSGGFRDEARAAIREVATWLREQDGRPLSWDHAAQWLEKEAGQ